MKKALFAALGFCSFIAVSAQTSATSTAPVNVKIDKTVEIVHNPDGNIENAFNVVFNAPGHFGNWRPTQDQYWRIHSTDAGTYTVTFSRGTIPAGIDLNYRLHHNGILKTIPIFQSVDTKPSFTNAFDAGTNNNVRVLMQAKVPWGISSGTYSGLVTVTATAL